MPISNASFLDLACTAAELADGWADNDTGVAVSTSETNAPAADPMATVWSFDTNISAAEGYVAARLKEVGSIDGVGNRLVVSVKFYFDAITGDRFLLEAYRSDWRFYASFEATGLFIHNGTAVNEVGTDLVVQDTWQEWTFDFDFSGGVASATCDVYLDDVLKASDVDCSFTGSYIDGEMYLEMSGAINDDRIAYIDYIKIGDGFVAVEFVPKIMMP